MAKVYTTDVPEPNFRDAFENGQFNMAKHTALEQKYVEDVKHRLEEMGYGGKHFGEIMRFPVADGYAQYMVAKARPFTLVHLALGDGWHIPAAHARGLTLADLEDELKRQKFWQEIADKQKQSRIP